MKLFFIYLWLYVIEFNSFYNMTTNEQLKLKKINDGNDTYLIIVNDTYNLKNKSYEKGQCVKVVNHFIVANSSQEDVDDILTTTKINRIVIDKRVTTRKDFTLKRNKYGEIRNSKVIILPDKDDDEEFNIISVNCFFINICDFSWYEIKSQKDLDNLLDKNRTDATLNFDYCKNTDIVQIGNQRELKNQYDSNINEEKVL